MSQCDRILQVLKDNQPHGMREIHQQAGFMRLNSRISELRTRGHHITCVRKGDDWIYQLESSPRELTAATTPYGDGRENTLLPLGSPAPTNSGRSVTEPLDVLVALSYLSPEEREAWVDSRLVERSNPEIGQTLGVSKQWVWTLVRQAQEKLERLVEGAVVRKTYVQSATPSGMAQTERREP